MNSCRFFKAFWPDVYLHIQIGADFLVYFYLNRVDVKQGVVRTEVTSIHAATLNHYS